MRVCFRQINKLYDLNQIEVLKDFTEFLHSQMELNNDIVINFLNKREDEMTTGVRKPGNEMCTLCFELPAMQRDSNMCSMRLKATGHPNT